MCGIYGILSPGRSDFTREELLARMGAVIQHRGPDDFGHYVGDGVALGMRRLSIIDVAGGHQPICNEDETVWLVMNGEIYNFQELRAELEKKGHRFRTRTDTEVIVHLYEEQGLDFFKRLRGMFGLALWDTKLRRLVIGRDRIGEKPIYVRRDPDRLAFASELKAILQLSDIPREINPVALQEYLALGYVPAPLCLLAGFEKLMPGHYLVVEKGVVKDCEYWDVPFASTDKCSEPEWIERIQAKLLETVKMQMVSDVPLGAFLSGGVDSSTIVAAMARATSQPVKTYAIGYDGEHSYYNELPYASVVAKAFGTDHHEIVVRPNVSELLPKLIWHLDEPVADSAILTTYLVSRLARESVTVILSGVGGDELFGGYRRYLGGSLQKYYGMLPGPLRRSVLPALFRNIPQDRHSSWKDYARYAAAFVNAAELPAAERYMKYVTVFSPQFQQNLLQNQSNGKSSSAAAAVALHRYFDRCTTSDALNRIMYVDLKTSLPDDLLALTDRMTMAASIECRAPLVDFELIELAMRMPSAYKVRGMTMKYLMKKAVEPWIPKEVIYRKKRGFGAPMGAWLRTDLQPLMQEFLSESAINRRGIFRWSAVQSIIADHQAQRRDHTDHLFSLIALEQWCRIYLDSKDAPATSPDEIAHMQKPVVAR
ncbi:MAG TPA: asparagine synthase (glutamine-hydrolyzing) [Candidatus Saccharimonadales bacterium]|nr:asparagine synthase (glutamine-hydrolyzing) [Candidatus Saccharimonadales bacterium]